MPTSGEEGGGYGYDCRTVLAEVRREMASQVRRMREEVIGALSLLLAERGLGTWEEGKKLQHNRGRLERDRMAAQKEHEVVKGSGRRVAREREATVEVEAAARRQEAVGVA